MYNLNDKVCLVTGAGRGLGRAIVKVLGEARAIIAGVDLHDELLETLGRELSERDVPFLPVRADVSDESQVQGILDQVYDRFGRLDCLINNAGVDVTRPIEEMTVADWDRIMGVNLRGPFLMSRAALTLMRQRSCGHIVNIVSTASKRAWANAAAYHASKWGLLGFSHALHVECRSYNIKVTAVVSGGMRTPFLLERFPDIDLSTLQDPENVARTVRFILEQPNGTVIPEIMVIPMKETSWP